MKRLFVEWFAFTLGTGMCDEDDRDTNWSGGNAAVTMGSLALVFT
jgi:hypothetical protein